MSAWSPVVSSTQDAEPPGLVFDPAGALFTTLADPVLHGEASDDLSGVAGVIVSSASATSSNAFANWSKALSGLAPGANSLTITASDNAEPPNTASVTYVVHRIATPTADADEDGINDLIESAFNLDPAVRDASGLPQVSLQNDGGSGRSYLTLQYRRRIHASGFRYIVETSSTLDPLSWTSTGTDVEQTGVTPTGDGVTELCTVRITPATDAVLCKFVRLRVEVD